MDWSQDAENFRPTCFIFPTCITEASHSSKWDLFKYEITRFGMIRLWNIRPYCPELINNSNSRVLGKEGCLTLASLKRTVWAPKHKSPQDAPEESGGSLWSNPIWWKGGRPGAPETQAFVPALPEHCYMILNKSLQLCGPECPSPGRLKGSRRQSPKSLPAHILFHDCVTIKLN